MDNPFFGRALLVRRPRNRISTQSFLTQPLARDQHEHFHNGSPWCWATPNGSQSCQIHGWVGKLPANRRNVQITVTMTRKTTLVGRLAILCLLVTLAASTSPALAAPSASFPCGP